MSIICTEIKDCQFLDRNPRRGIGGFLWATIDPTTAHQIPFPSDYKYFSCMLPRKYALWADRIQNFKVRPDDIWVIGLRKTGTTWVRNIVHQLKIKNLDFTAEYMQPTGSGSGYLERPIIIEKIDGDEEITKHAENRDKSLDELEVATSPRMIKSHLPAYLLPRELWTIKPKIIYTSRDAKDVAVSMYHMLQNFISPYEGSKDDFFDAIMNGFFGFFPFYEHISSFTQLKGFGNILFLTYEELTTDTFENVKRVSEFLECSYSDEQLRQLIEHVSFGKMRDEIVIPTINPDFKFCRKGLVGGYQGDMSEEYIQRFDEWTAKEKEKLNLP